MVTMSGNRLLSLIRVKGISYDTREDEELIALYEARNAFFLTIGKKEGKNLMVQTWTTKTGIELNSTYVMPLQPLQEFVDEYTSSFRNGTFKQVGYSFALILKYRDLDDGIRRMKELLDTSEKMLNDFDPAIMGLEETEYGALFSQVGRFVSLLVNGHEEDVLLSDTRLGEAAIDSVTSFDQYDFVENRPNRGGRRFATTYDLRDYPNAGSFPGMWDEATEAQFEFTLVQTFIFEDRNKAKSDFQKHVSDLGAVEKDNKQTQELEKAIQDIMLGDKAFGRYSASLIVYGDTPDDAIDNGSKLASVFSVRDATFKRSTMSNVDTWYTQFPGATDAMYPMSKSTENLACTFSMHTSPTGKANGNPIGDGTGLVPMRTVTDGLFILNMHDSAPGQNNLGELLPGHMAVTGATGVGKTTVEGVIVTFLARFGPMVFCIDYNESFKNLLETLGTQYYSIQPGINTDINPFQFDDCTELRELLFNNVLCCAGGVSKTNDEEQEQIHKAIASVMKHSVRERRGMSLLIQGITAKGGDCLHTRLSKWCRLANGRQGRNAWVLDSPINKFDAKRFTRLAYDCTQVLDKEYSNKNPEILEVLLNTLFYMKREMHQCVPGSLLLNIVAEYWVPLSFESTADKIKEILKSGRMRGELLVMDTQSPEDAISTKYAPAIIQQVVTSIWLANTRADRAGYAKFGIKGKVFDAVAALRPLSREMVVLQGHQAVQLKMVLDDRLKYWLPLLSSTKKNIAVAKRIKDELGTTAPELWVPAFLIAEHVRLWLNTEDPGQWLPMYRKAQAICTSLNTNDPTIWMPALQAERNRVNALS
ncbi:VirB4 family type IV secretion system protein [Pseudomonas fragariae (ex Marin et al. 2024)]|uniref:VirB4 family type IV secretion system protein n=1 Tax=Pseudomonas fragariae (ex Marin et al. 2024) TaxID=3080056 RepID=UPI003F7B2A1A